jgi:hypothetical protein
MPLMTIAFFPLEFVTPETNYVDSHYRRIFTDGRDLPECTLARSLLRGFSIP